MILPKDKVLDDLKKAATGTLSAVGGIVRTTRQHVRDDLKARADELALRLDLVPREEFERLEIVLTETRALVEAQAARIDALEDRFEETKRTQALGTLSAKRP